MKKKKKKNMKKKINRPKKHAQSLEDFCYVLAEFKSVYTT